MAFISALASLAKNEGANRVVHGIKIPHPCGNPALPPDRDKEMRRRIVLTALEALTTEVREPVVFTNPGVLM